MHVIDLRFTVQDNVNALRLLEILVPALTGVSPEVAEVAALRADGLGGKVADPLTRTSLKAG